MAEQEAGLSKELHLPLPYEAMPLHTSGGVGSGKKSEDVTEKENQADERKKKKDFEDSWGQNNFREEHGVNIISNELGPIIYPPPPHKPNNPTCQHTQAAYRRKHPLVGLFSK